MQQNKGEASSKYATLFFPDEQNSGDFLCFEMKLCTFNNGSGPSDMMQLITKGDGWQPGYVVGFFDSQEEFKEKVDVEIKAFREFYGSEKNYLIVYVPDKTLKGEPQFKCFQQTIEQRKYLEVADWIRVEDDACFVIAIYDSSEDLSEDFSRVTQNFTKVVENAVIEKPKNLLKSIPSSDYFAVVEAENDSANSSLASDEPIIEFILKLSLKTSSTVPSKRIITKIQRCSQLKRKQKNQNLKGKIVIDEIVKREAQFKNSGLFRMFDAILPRKLDESSLGAAAAGTETLIPIDQNKENNVDVSQSRPAWTSRLDLLRQELGNLSPEEEVILEWPDQYMTITRRLMYLHFSRQTLKTHSLSGNKSNAFPSVPAKPPLDQEIVKRIKLIVKILFGLSESNIRHVLARVCNSAKQLRLK